MIVLYVTGCGRSGSTLLDSKMAQNAGVFGAGELANLFEWADLGLPCECTELVTNCVVWGPLLARCLETCSFEEANRVTRLCETTNEVTEEYRALWEPILRELEKGGYEVVVDSSKTTSMTTRRPEVLSRLGFEVVPVHLVRNPSDVISSVLWSSNRRLQGIDAVQQRSAVKVALSWLKANFWAHRSSQALSAPKNVVRFEDVSSRWEAVEVEIFKQLELGASAPQSPSSQPGHAIAGNRARSSGYSPGLRPASRGQRARTDASAFPLRPIRRLLIHSKGMNLGNQAE